MPQNKLFITFAEEYPARLTECPPMALSASQENLINATGFSSSGTLNAPANRLHLFSSPCALFIAEFLGRKLDGPWRNRGSEKACHAERQVKETENAGY